MNYINEYNETSVIRNFPNLDEQLTDYFDILWNIESSTTFTPRALHQLRIGYRDIFYYISWLYDSNPNSIIDLGCGDRLFDRWFPNLYGVDITTAYSSIKAPDEIIKAQTFYTDNKEKFDCGIAINSLQLREFDLSLNYVMKAMDLIKPKGRFLFTLYYNWINFPKSHVRNKKLTPEIINKLNEVKLLDEKLYTYLTSSRYKLILFDPVYSRGFNLADVQLNGTTRFILEK